MRSSCPRSRSSRPFEALGFDALGRSTEGRADPRAPLRRAGAGRCWCSGASTATSRRACEALVELAARLAATSRAGAPVLAAARRSTPTGSRAGARTRRATSTSIATSRRELSRPPHAPGYFPGPRRCPSPRRASLAALVDARAVAAVVAVHAPFACVNYDGPAAAWAEAVAAACGWPARADIGYPTPGSLGSWLGVDRGLPVLTLELPPGPAEPFRGQPRRRLDESIRAARFQTSKLLDRRVLGSISWPPFEPARLAASASCSLNRPTGPSAQQDHGQGNRAQRSSRRCREGAGLPPLRPEGPARGGRRLRSGARGARAGGRHRRPRHHAQGRQRRGAAALHART